MNLKSLSPVLKAVVAAVLGAVVPLATVALSTGKFDWKAIASAAAGAAITALGVYLAPNKPAAKV